MYAVIQTGGKQYEVSPGEVIKVERLKGEIDSRVEFDRVHLLVKDEQVRAGSQLANLKVQGTILGEEKGKKVIAFKYKKRKNYKRKVGHRQIYTRVRIDEINDYSEVSAQVSEELRVKSEELRVAETPHE